MIIENIQMVNKGCVVCRFDLLVEKWGDFIIRDLTYFQQNNKDWISFPSKSYEKDGKKKYWPYNAFKDRDMQDKFFTQVKDELKFKLNTMPQDSNPLGF